MTTCISPATNNRKFRIFFLEERSCNNGAEIRDYEIIQAVVSAFKNGYHEFYNDLCYLYEQREKNRICSDQLIARMAAIVKQRLDDKTKKFKEALDILEERKKELLQDNNDRNLKELCDLLKRGCSLFEEIEELMTDQEFWEVI